MAKTRKALERIPFDDLTPGMLIHVEWDAGDLLEKHRGAFVRFDAVGGEWFLVLRVVEHGARGVVDRGNIEISTRAGLRIWREMDVDCN